MDRKAAEKIVTEAIKEVLDGELTNDLMPESELIGNDPILDSMQLVEVCVLLEDIADGKGFEFDWTSEAAMSKSKSMFRDIESLSEEFSKQSENR